MKLSTVGMSLLEVILVLLLLTAAAAWGASSFAGWRARYELVQSARNLADDLRAARSLAVVHALPHGVVAETPGTAYSIVEWSDPQRPLLRIDLPRRLSLAGGPVWFHPRGNAAPAGSLTLAASGDTLAVIVSVSGRIRWEVRR